MPLSRLRNRRERKPIVKLIVMKKGGEPGDVAINPEKVTHVRTASGPFTDIYFGEHRVAVEGSFAQVVARLTGQAEAPDGAAAKSWFPAR
jgi:putative component of toxin-antitoxin plasmid stabilization module